LQPNRLRILSLESLSQGIVLRHLAARGGAGISSAATVGEAEQMMAAGQFDLILVNISAAMEHLDFIGRLKLRRPAVVTPVIAFAEQTSSLIENAYDAGAACVITRPNDDTTAFTAVDECLSFWNHIAMLPGSAHAYRRTVDTSPPY